MLGKVFYLYEYIDSSWERFDETLPGKREFYSNLKKEGNTGADYDLTKRAWEYLEYKT